jgi:DNA repair protein NreA
MSFICVKCKVKNPSGCSRPDCPIFAKMGGPRRISLLTKQDFFGKAPSVFVGRHGYPDVNVGFLSAEEYKENDNPLLWSKENYSIDSIIKLRTQLVNSNFKTSIKSFEDRLVEMGTEVGMAKDPVDMEINLTKKPEPTISFEGTEATPHGPNVKLRNARITENAKIPQIVEKMHSDAGLKAGDALNTLYKRDFDEHYLSRLLSIGTLGVKQQRKMVPTRWSITAVDDTLGKSAIDEIKKYPVHDFAVFYGGHLGNYYIALLFPEPWSYELFETYAEQNPMHDPMAVQTSTDYEPYEGRKTYASETVGGYYAARLAVLEYLRSKKRQATVLLFRFITKEYYAPLGVWVVRQASRKAMQSKPLNFDSKELMVNYAKALIKKRLSFDATPLIKRSIVLNTINSQAKLGSFY